MGLSVHITQAQNHSYWKGHETVSSLTSCSKKGQHQIQTFLFRVLSSQVSKTSKDRDETSRSYDFAFVLVEFHKVIVDPFLQPVSVPLDGSPAPEHVSWSPQFAVICKRDKTSSRLLIQMSKRTGPRTGPCSAPTATDIQGFHLLATIHWAWSSKQSFMCWVVHPFRLS